MMALRKEPERRYGSVEQLAADLDRYLRGHPVAVRPDSLAYRTAKLVRRHRVAAAAAALLALGRFDEAEAVLTEAGRIRGRHGAAAWQRAEVDVWRAACRVERGDVSADVETALTEGIAALTAQYGEATERAEVARRALGRLHAKESSRPSIPLTAMDSY